ncbi:hypothetical protein [Celeribacter baekdonensis]|nr:hypothetical protein [Celeribacter baekdonensis]
MSAPVPVPPMPTWAMIAFGDHTPGSDQNIGPNGEPVPVVHPAQRTR